MAAPAVAYQEYNPLANPPREINVDTPVDTTENLQNVKAIYYN